MPYFAENKVPIKKLSFKVDLVGASSYHSAGPISERAWVQFSRKRAKKC